MLVLFCLQNVYAFAAKPGESFVGQVLAQNSNGDVTYRIAEGGETLFQINGSDGRIFYHGPISKDSRNYELKVNVIFNELINQCINEYLIEVS